MGLFKKIGRSIKKGANTLFQVTTIPQRLAGRVITGNNKEPLVDPNRNIFSTIQSSTNNAAKSLPAILAGGNALKNLQQNNNPMGLFNNQNANLSGGISFGNQTSRDLIPIVIAIAVAIAILFGGGFLSFGGGKKRKK